MFCIAAFIILSILGIFSVRYRRLASDAWKCVSRKVTFKKCDTNFKEDLKNQLLGKLVLRRPRLARFLEKWIEVLAFAFVVLTVWSLLSVLRSGLYLYVYDTCRPANSESCSLGAEACSVESIEPSFWQSIKNGRLQDWASSDVRDIKTAISRVPDRLKKWQPAIYTTADNTYYYKYDQSKPTALEIVDPGCKYCAKLFGNIEQTNVEGRYNLTYLVYPIPNPRYQNAYKFQNSYLMASYLEATKLTPLANAKTPADWQLLQRIFTWKDPSGSGYQAQIDNLYSSQQTEILLKKWLINIGYSPDQIAIIAKNAKSPAVSASIARQRQIVEKQIKTVKIPTLLLGQRRFDGVASTKSLE